MSKAPSLEERIATILNNANAGAAELSELVVETERAIVAADEDIAATEQKAVDLVASPNAKTAYDEAEMARLNRDRLRAALPKLRDRLVQALATERHDRWHAEYERVETGYSLLQQDIDDFHNRFADEADTLEERIDAYNDETERVNEFAFQIDEHQRLPRLSLWASTSDERRWGPPKVEGRFAAAYAQSLAPAMPHPGDRWWDPSHPVVAAQRQAMERERETIARAHEQAAKEQEERENREERARFTALNRL